MAKPNEMIEGGMQETLIQDPFDDMDGETEYVLVITGNMRDFFHWV